MTDDRRFLSHACLEPKVERDQDGPHPIIPFRNKTSLGLVFSPTVRLDSQSLVQFRQFIFSGKKTGGKNRGRERSAASMLLLRVRENMYNSSSSSAVWGLGCLGVRHTAFIDNA